MARPDQIRTIVWKAQQQLVLSVARNDQKDANYQRGRRDAALEILRMEE